MTGLRYLLQDGRKHFAWEVAYSHEECRFMCEVYAPDQIEAERKLELLKSYDKIKVIQRSAERCVTSFNHSIQVEGPDGYRFWIKEVWTGSSSLFEDLMLHLLDIIDTGKVTGSRNVDRKTPA